MNSGAAFPPHACTPKDTGDRNAASASHSSVSRRHPFVARFDIRHYYESFDHRILLDLLAQCGVSEESTSLVEESLSLPDRDDTGKGMIAGGARSTCCRSTGR